MVEDLLPGNLPVFRFTGEFPFIHIIHTYRQYRLATISGHGSLPLLQPLQGTNNTPRNIEVPVGILVV